jgi:hypothetical protein
VVHEDDKNVLLVHPDGIVGENEGIRAGGIDCPDPGANKIAVQPDAEATCVPELDIEEYALGVE